LFEAGYAPSSAIDGRNSSRSFTFSVSNAAPDLGRRRGRRIDAVTSEEATHLPMAMPGMTHEEIGEGNYLLRVDATLDDAGTRLTLDAVTSVVSDSHDHDDDEH
jgi:hypothetical protein